MFCPVDGGGVEPAVGAMFCPVDKGSPRTTLNLWGVRGDGPDAWKNNIESDAIFRPSTVADVAKHALFPACSSFSA